VRRVEADPEAGTRAPTGGEPRGGGEAGQPPDERHEEWAEARRVADEIARDAGAVLLQGWGTRPEVQF
jgi:hypothetical protein